MSSTYSLTPEKYAQRVIDNRARRLKKAAALREHIKKSIDRTRERLHELQK